MTNKSFFSTFNKEDKLVFIISTLFSVVTLLVLLVLSICHVISYWLILSNFIGYVIGVIMHYLTVIMINKSQVENYKIVVKNLFVTRQLAYVISLIGVFFFTRDIWPILCCLLGILSIKFAIYLLLLRRKGVNE